MDSTRFMSCELKVDTASPGWHKTMRRMCDRIKEVSYSIDAQTGIVHVSGRINPRTLLKLLEDSGKHAALVRVDSGTRGPQDPEFPPPENGYYPEYTPYDPRAPPPPPPPPPPPLPPPPPPLPMPPRYTYSEPGFQQQPPHIDPYYGSESDGQCSIM